MKSTILNLKIFTALFVLILSIQSIKSQDYQVVSSTGENDSLNAQVNISLFREFVKNNNFTLALQPWRTAFLNYPAASKNIYLDGSKIISYYIDKENDESIKSLWVDTLMMLYDQRIKYFGQEGFVLGRKGVDLLKYRKQDFEKAYQNLKRCAELQKNETEGAVLVTLMQVSVSKFKSGKHDSNQVVNDFSSSIEILRNQKSSISDEKKLNTVNQNIEYIEKMFSSSGAASCDNLIALYQTRFEQNPNDSELLKKILQQFEDSKCQEFPLYARASENLHRINPTAETATSLARLHINSKHFSKAIDFYLEAAKLETIPEKLAQIYYEIALVSYSELKQYENARNYLLKAIEADSKGGRFYITLAKIYSSGAKNCGSNDFETAAVYWLVVDKLQKAKSVDPGVSNEAEELIALYKAYFPKREEAFFYGVNEGDTFKIACWIQENTKARFLK